MERYDVVVTYVDANHDKKPMACMGSISSPILCEEQTRPCEFCGCSQEVPPCAQHSPSGALAQSVSPLSTDKRPNIAPQTHCKDKSGAVWLKSSAQLAGRTDPAQTTTGNGTEASQQRRPVESAGAADVREIAKTLPDCP